MCSIASWNIRGLNHPSKQSEVKSFLDKFNVGFIGILEVKINQSNFEKVKRGCMPNDGWEVFCHFDQQTKKARILLLWNPSYFSVSIEYADNQIILCNITWQGMSFKAAFVYAFNEACRRNVLWDLIIDKTKNSIDPWVICGDFNCIFKASEKLNGSRVLPADTKELEHLLNTTGLEDMKAFGNFYTWNDKHSNSDRIWCKLDRILCNQSFLSVLPQAYGWFPEAGLSDHCPALIKIGIESHRKSWFRFKNFWVHTEEFQIALRKFWRIGANNLFDISKRLKLLKAGLKKDMRHLAGNLDIKVERDREGLRYVQEALRLQPLDPNLISQEQEKVNALRNSLKFQFIYYCQKARINWAKEGDLNTRYFHNVIRGRRNQNRISAVMKQNGSWSFDSTEIKLEFVTYFSSLMNGEIGEPLPLDHVMIQDGRCIEADECFELTKDISFNELGMAIKSLPGNKAAGPDGFSVEFYKAAWSCRSLDLFKGISQFFRDSIMPYAVNSNYLALIPKSANPRVPKDYRPVSCCNVLYKIISTILANRLRACLPNIIGASQSAFVQGRNISHNICLAKELLVGYNRKNISKRCVMKFDICKAFDMVSWKFIESSLQTLRFPHKFIGWIMACIKSARFSVLINGQLEGFFGSNRGIRQGDPLSPFLFTIVMEILSRRINYASNEKQFSFHPKCRRVNLSHLLFADDLLVFCKADKGSMSCIKRAIEDFGLWSGLSMNLDKSDIYFGGISDIEGMNLAGLMGIRIGKFPFRYLGIPIDAKRLGLADYSEIIEKMTAKIASWTARCLSYAGRLVLIKHVISTIGCYWMRTMLFPKEVLRRVTSICRAYLWSGKSEGKRNLVSWKAVCENKSSGGLGVKDLVAFNKALMMTHIWDISLKKDNLWIKWMNNYFFKDTQIWEMEERQHLPWTLKALIRLKKEAFDCIQMDSAGRITWKIKSDPFTVKGTYDGIRLNGSEVSWHKLVWNCISPSKHSFCVWLAVKGGLPTKSRLHIVDDTCCWCSEKETTDHIFFGCANMQVLKKCLELWGHRSNFQSWEHTLTWFAQQKWRCKAEKWTVALIINASVYEVWINRNAKIFGKQYFNEDALKRKVIKTAALKIELLHQKKKNFWNETMQKMILIYNRVLF